MKAKLTPQEHTLKTTELQQILDDCPKLTADRTRWDLDGSWEGVTVHFIDSRERPTFAPWRDFTCKTVKLVNYDTPAVRIAFFPKHKYWVMRDDDLTSKDKRERLLHLIGSIELRIGRLETQLDHTDPPPLTLFSHETAPDRQLTSSSARIQQLMNELYEEKKTWLAILDDMASYELAVSTYRRGYTYLYIHWKYHLPNGKFDRSNEHLLNNKRDKLGNINQVKHNVVFIDTEEIFRPHPYQSKEVELFLKRFPIRSSQTVPDVYARRRPENDSLDLFK